MSKTSKKKKQKRPGFLFLIPFLICLSVFGFALFKIAGVQNDYKEGVDEYKELRKYTEKKKEKDPDKCPIKVNFKKLRKINPDVVGWIHIPHSQISYPIVQGKDNEYYLHRTFEGKSNFAGSIFLASECRADFLSANSVVYGHNLRNGNMFGMLKKYYDTKYNEKANYKKRKIIWIITPDKEREYTIFSAREISVKTDMEAYTIDFGTVEEYDAFLKNAKAKSLYDTGVPVDTSNYVLTLSTCTSTTETGRFIVVAKLIQETDR